MYHIKKDQRSRLSAKLIFDGLGELLKENEYEDIRITDIVKKAEVGRATFYRNFDNKIDVLRYESDKVFIEMMEHLKTYHSKRPVNRSSEFLVPFLEFFDSRTQIVEMLIKANHQDIMTKSLSKSMEEVYNNYTQVADAPDETWDYFLAIRSGITINILVQWVKSGKNIEPLRLGKLMSQQVHNSFSVNQFF